MNRHLRKESIEEEIDEKTAYENTGYDGQCVDDYGDRVLSIMSKHVLDEIVTLSRADVLSFWGITSTGQRSEMGHMVENLFWVDLKKPYQMRRYPMVKETKTQDTLGVQAKAGDLVLNRGNCQHCE